MLLISFLTTRIIFKYEYKWKYKWKLGFWTPPRILNFSSGTTMRMTSYILDVGFVWDEDISLIPSKKYALFSLGSFNNYVDKSLFLFWQPSHLFYSDRGPKRKLFDHLSISSCPHSFWTTSFLMTHILYCKCTGVVFCI